MTTLYGGRPESWNINIIGVTSRATFDAIQKHGDYAYVQKLSPRATRPHAARADEHLPVLPRPSRARIPASR